MPRAVEVDCFDQLPLYREKGGSREVSVQRLAVSLVKTYNPEDLNSVGGSKIGVQQHR